MFQPTTMGKRSARLGGPLVATVTWRTDQRSRPSDGSGAGWGWWCASLTLATAMRWRKTRRKRTRPAKPVTHRLPTAAAAQPCHASPTTNLTAPPPPLPPPSAWSGSTPTIYPHPPRSEPEVPSCLATALNGAHTRKSCFPHLLQECPGYVASLFRWVLLLASFADAFFLQGPLAEEPDHLKHSVQMFHVHSWFSGSASVSRKEALFYITLMKP